MIETNIIGERRNLKYFQSNIIVVNAEDTNLGNKYANLELNSTKSNHMQKNIQKSLRKMQRGMRL